MGGPLRAGARGRAEAGGPGGWVHALSGWVGCATKTLIATMATTWNSIATKLMITMDDHDNGITMVMVHHRNGNSVAIRKTIAMGYSMATGKPWLRETWLLL